MVDPEQRNLYFQFLSNALTIPELRIYQDDRSIPVSAFQLSLLIPLSESV